MKGAEVDLRPFISGYWRVSAHRSAGEIDNFLPGLPLAWIFSTGDTAKGRLRQKSFQQPRAFVKGLTSASCQVIPGRFTENIGIAFQAGCAAPFHRLPLHLVGDDLIDIRDLGDRELADLALRVEGQSLRAAAKMFDEFLMGRLSSARDPHLGHLLFERLAASPNAGIRELSDNAGLSERQYRRLCRVHIGGAPKRVQRVLRLRRALLALNLPKPRLTEIAQSVGYFDQAHLNEDFRNMLGAAPRSLMSRDAGLAELFAPYEAG